MHRRRLTIADPCEEDLSRMPRDGAAIRCARCQKPVHDLSTMTEPQARRLLRAHAGRQLCVKYRFDGRGRLQFHPSPPMAMRAPMVLALALAACAGYAEPGEVDSHGRW